MRDAASASSFAAFSSSWDASFVKWDDRTERPNGCFGLRALAHVAADAADTVELAQLCGLEFDFLFDRLVGVVGGFEARFSATATWLVVTT